VLVLGRAKDKRGNALALLDVSGARPRAIWAHGESGFAHADGTRIGEDEALLPGRLEFQPGPVCTRGLVIAQVLQWLQPGVSPADQHVEVAKTSAWLVALDAATGRVAWKRRIASGADRRARTASRFAGERGLSCACLPLALRSDEILAATELGIVGRYGAADGSLHGSWRMRRARPVGDAAPGFGGPIPVARADGRLGFFALLCADSGGVATLDGPDYDATHSDAAAFGASGTPVSTSPASIRSSSVRPVPIRMDGLERLVAASPTTLTALVRSHGRLVLRVVATSPSADAAAGAGAESVPLPRGARWKGSVAGTHAILCAFDGRVALLDSGSTELALGTVLDLAGLEGEADCGLLVHGERAYVLGTRRAWVLRLQ
jgi:hypothetical protein